MEQGASEGLVHRDVEHELRATLEARRELGPELDDQLVEAFLARVQQRIDAQVAQQVATTGPKPKKKTTDDRVQVEIIAGSFALAIPLMAIAGDVAGSVGIFMVAIALIAVNLLYFIDRWVRFNTRA